jgi:hypothetical protein
MRGSRFISKINFMKRFPTVRVYSPQCHMILYGDGDGMAFRPRIARKGLKGETHMKHLLSMIGGAMLGLVFTQGGPALAVDTTTSIVCTDPTLPFTARLEAAKQGYPDPGHCWAYPMADRAAYAGRSVATGQMGIYCATPAKTCELYRASYVGGGCSCRVPGGRSRGFVSP